MLVSTMVGRLASRALVLADGDAFAWLYANGEPQKKQK